MNREILFRGKRKSDGEWIFGNLLRTDDDGICIIQNHVPHHFLKNYEVDQETICQYTGLIDKNGKRIFENDIVKFRHGGEFHDKGIWCRNYAVEYVNTFCTYGLRFRNKSIHFPCKQSTVSMNDVEVIGNIFDNPELLDKAGEPNGKS